MFLSMTLLQQLQSVLCLLVALLLPACGSCPTSCHCDTQPVAPKIVCAGEYNYRPYYFTGVYHLRLYKHVELRCYRHSQLHDDTIQLHADTFYGMANISTLILSKCRIGILPSRVFSALGPHLHLLSIENSVVSRIEPGALFNTTIHDLNFINSSIDVLSKRAFAPSLLVGQYTTIKHLTFQGCHIRAIKTHAFAGIHNAERITLKEGNISEVEVGGFGLVDQSVSVISILRNQVVLVASRAFRGTAAQAVQIFANNITLCADRCLEDLQQQVRANDSSKTKVVKVDIHSNNFTCDCHLLSILGRGSPVDVQWNKCGSPVRFRGYFLDQVKDYLCSSPLTAISHARRCSASFASVFAFILTTIIVKDIGLVMKP